MLLARTTAITAAYPHAASQRSKVHPIIKQSKAVHVRPLLAAVSSFPSYFHTHYTHHAFFFFFFFFFFISSSSSSCFLPFLFSFSFVFSSVFELSSVFLLFRSCQTDYLAKYKKWRYSARLNKVYGVDLHVNVYFLN
jgi:hypothetical protein